MNPRTVIILWLIVSAICLTLYFWQEGFHLTPNPSHWWWYATTAALLGFNVGQHYERWDERRWREKLNRIQRGEET